MASESIMIDSNSLLEAARIVRERAYAPYSNYQVGAAVLTGSGKIYTGCNIENASFGATVCAERVAVASAIAAGEREIKALAVVTDGQNPGPPCGICRQFLVEFADDLPIFLGNLQGQVVLGNLSDYLPKSFHGRFLGGSIV
jgi:cytidine deaminase